MHFQKNCRLTNWNVFKNKSYVRYFNPHIHELFSQRYCMKWVPRDSQKKMLNYIDKITFFLHKSVSILLNKKNTMV